MQELADYRGIQLPAERRAMQDFGDALDKETNGQWVAQGVSRLIASSNRSTKLVIVDSVRHRSQIDALRSAYPGRFFHIHVHAPAKVLDWRYRQRGTGSGFAELPSYSAVAQNKTEREVAQLHAEADVAIDTDRCTAADVEIRAAAALRLLSRRDVRLVDVIIGSQYGSEGKGNIAYYLADEYQVLMRVGGPNAGHKVPTTPAYTHCLLPSGTLANSRATLLIGPGATLDLTQLHKEIAECGVSIGRLFIDPQAMIIEAADIAAEEVLVKGIGSTGKGGGAATARRILGRHGGEPPVRLARDVAELQSWLRSAADVLDAAFRSQHRVLLEGTQGTGLSLFHGSYPYVTGRDTTTAGCLAEAGISPSRVRRVIMVTRSYPIRVKSPDDSTSGYMSQELDWADIADRSGVDVDELLKVELGSRSHKLRRVGEFDWQLLRRSAELNGATDIALTFADYLNVTNRAARRYNQLDQATTHFIEEIEQVSGAPVTLISTRFDPRSVIDRRTWE
ncbi:adenylosuccinate synthase [Actinopolymorpha pittospori]|uniref:Adenylosuccinate synthetase n=2 Tax=Actinopolymorpha pittospori TaxID=648752 RepID=A0A927MY70_9ACTN|nr:adenylosuccinate synthase [Actinopolymorpha pittospori]